MKWNLVRAVTLAASVAVVGAMASYVFNSSKVDEGIKFVGKLSNTSYSHANAKEKKVLARNLPEAKGNDVVYEKSTKGYTEMHIGPNYSFGFANGNIKAVDNNGDYRFDRIELNGVPKGSELEQLATFDNLAVIAKAVEKR